MSIGKRMKDSRISCNKTLEEVAKLVGVSRQTLSRYENEIIGNIPSDNIEKIAQALHTTPAYLMGWEGDAQSEPTREDGLTEEQRLLIRTIETMPVENVRKLLVIVEQVLSEPL